MAHWAVRGENSTLPSTDCGENRVQVFAPLPRLHYGLGAMQAVLQFDHGNGRQHDLGFSVLVFERGEQFTHRSGVALSGDQHAGIKD